MLIIPRYILREHFSTFILSLITIIFLFLSNYLMQNISRFVNKGLQISMLFELMFYNIAWILALAVPMSVLISTLMSFGRLSQDNEMIALRTSGISIYKIIFPVLLVSVFLMFAMIEFNNKVLPNFNHRAKLLLMDISQKKPTLNIEEGEFTSGEEIAHYRLLVRRIEKDSPWVYGVTIFDNKNPKVQRTITAEKAKMSISYALGNINMLLFKGEVHDLEINNPSKYNKMVFDSNRVIIPVPNMQLMRSSRGYRGEREKSAGDLKADVDTIKVQISRLRKDYRASLKKQFDNRYKRIKRLQKKITLNGNYSNNEYLSEGPAVNYPFLNSAKIRAERVAKNLMHMSNNNITRMEINTKNISKFMVEYYKKFSIPASCIMFVLLGAPLGIMSKRGGISVGGSIGLAFFIFSWAFLIGGEELADRKYMSPFLAMWLSNIIVGSAGIILILRLAKENRGINFSIFKKIFAKFNQ